MINRINLLIVTFFYTGYIKIIPGTFASLFTSIILYFFFKYFFSFEFFLFFLSVILFVFIYSLYAIKTLENKFQEIDAKEIVIDEVIGQMFPIIMIEYITFSNTNNFGAGLLLYLISFLLFRFYDIFKPFFIDYFDKNFKNSFGVMFDDILAGIYASLTLFLILELYKFL